MFELLRLPSTDLKVADRFEDLASALSAGLPIDMALSALGSSKAPTWHGAAIVDKIAGVVQLDPTEVLILAAAERSGRLDVALKERAGARRMRGDLVSQTIRSLAYPVLLASLAAFTGVFVGVLAGGSPLHFLGTLGLLGALAVGACVWLVKGLRTGRVDPARVPVIGSWLASVAELPILHALHGMYSAGLRLDEVLPEIAEMGRFGATKQRLRATAGIIASGRTLTEAISETGALDPETRILVANGERAGQLEEALARAITRRSHVLSLATRRLSRLFATAATLLAGGLAVFVILRFYLGILGAGIR